MINIIPMTEDYIDDVAKIDESCFHVPWTRSDYEKEKEARERRLRAYAEEVQK